VKCWMFVMRLSSSGKAFHVAYGTQAQEAFLEGHVKAFEYFGGYAGVGPRVWLSRARAWWRFQPWSADDVVAVFGAFGRP